MRQRLFGLWMVLIGLHAMKISTRPAVDSCSLKGDQISAQGFNPGLGNSRRCALKGHQNPAALYRIEIIHQRLSILAPLSGRIFLRGGYPGLKPWAKLFCSFGAQTLYPSLMLTRMGGRRTEATSSSSQADTPS